MVQLPFYKSVLRQSTSTHGWCRHPGSRLELSGGRLHSTPNLPLSTPPGNWTIQYNHTFWVSAVRIMHFRSLNKTQIKGRAGVYPRPMFTMETTLFNRGRKMASILLCADVTLFGRWLTMGCIQEDVSLYDGKKKIRPISVVQISSLPPAPTSPPPPNTKKKHKKEKIAVISLHCTGKKKIPKQTQ